MSTERRSEQRTWLSRSELQLELGKLAVRLAKAFERRQSAPDGRRRRARRLIDWFLDAGLRVLQKTQPLHRSYAIQRLSSMAETYELNLIGVDAWFAEQVASWRRRCDRAPLPLAGDSLLLTGGPR